MPGQPSLPPSDGFVEVDGTRLHYVDSGRVDSGRVDSAGVGSGGAGPARPAVVMLHGNPGTVKSYVPGVMTLLAPDLRGIAVDRPGHGDSERLRREGGSPSAQARAIRAGVRQLGVERPILVGHSWGGGLALVWALLFPDDVAGLVLAEGTYYDEPRLYDPSYPLLANRVLGPVVSRTLGPVLAARAMPRRLRTAWAPMPVPDEVLARAHELWTRPTVLRAIAGDVLGRAAELPALSERWSEIDVPTVIISCPDEEFVDPADHAGRLRRAIPQAQVVEVPGVGHALPDARPDVVAEAVRTLAGRLGPSAS